VVINPGGLIEVDDYNELALEINRLFSDTTVSLSYTGSNIILNTTASPSGEPAGSTWNLSSVVQPGDFVTATVNGVITLQEGVDFTLTYTNPSTITFIDPLGSNAQIVVYNRTTHRYGWGQQYSVYPITAGNPVLADEAVLQAYLEANVNNIIDKVNIIEERIDGPSQLTRVAQGALIRAQDKATIISTINNDVLTGDNYWKNTIATTFGSALSFERGSPWSDILIGEMRYSWDSYNRMRYFFNSGSDIRANVTMTGDPLNQGFANWRQVVERMGSMVMNYDTTFQTGAGGISENLGCYELTSEYQVVFTSSSPLRPVDNSGEYNSYDEYGDYTDLIMVWEARILEDTPSAGNISIDIRLTMNDQSLNATTFGTVRFNGGFTQPGGLVDNSATFFSPTPPTLTAINTFSDNDDDFLGIGRFSSLGVANGTSANTPFLVNAGSVSMRITPTILGNSGRVRYDNVTPNYVAPGESFNSLGTMNLDGDGTGSTLRIAITFEPNPGISASTEVDNLRFRINDIENNLASVNERLTFTAFDADNNPVPVTLTGGSNLSVVSNVVTSAVFTSDPIQAAHSVLVTVPGPVARVEFLYENLGTGVHNVYMTDVAFDTLPLS
jgi:hypothetical protein